jgi:uncharacterized protein (DUF2345 family)
VDGLGRREPMYLAVVAWRVDRLAQLTHASAVSGQTAVVNTLGKPAVATSAPDGLTAITAARASRSARELPLDG